MKYYSNKLEVGDVINLRSMECVVEKVDEVDGDRFVKVRRIRILNSGWSYNPSELGFEFYQSGDHKNVMKEVCVIGKMKLNLTGKSDGEKYMEGKIYRVSGD